MGGGVQAEERKVHQQMSLLLTGKLKMGKSSLKSVLKSLILSLS